MPLNSPIVDAHSSKGHYKNIALHLPLPGEENQKSTPTMNVITRKRPKQIQRQIAHRIHPAVNNNPNWQLVPQALEGHQVRITAQ